MINLYNEILKNEKLDTIYKSSIASRAAYQFIDVNLKDLSKNYQETIKSFINFIDDQLINFQGTKLELYYLLIILKQYKIYIRIKKYFINILVEFEDFISIKFNLAIFLLVT